jgi:hypothetical protein
MPTSAGPNIIGENNLVFAYDTGDKVNSYKGEPTVNVLPSNKVLLTSYNDHGGSHTTDTSFTLFGNASLKNTSNPAHDWNGVYHTGLSSLLTPGVTYTYSFYIYFTSDNTTISYFGYGAPGYTGVKGQWNRVSTTFTATTQDYFYVTLQYSLGQPVTTYYLANIQIEANTHATQFINGTRSATQGLLPIISNTSLDLSNVSFDSNAQIIFDGTNDHVDIGNLGTIGTEYSIECIFNSSAVVNYRNVFDMNYATYAGVTGNVGPRLEQYSDGTFSIIWSGVTNNNSLAVGTTPIAISANTNYHVTFVQNGTSGFVYLNGVYRNQTTNTYGYIQTFGDVNLGRGFQLTGDRYFAGLLPIFKIYNRALTSTEIQQNYQQYKSRFNLS